MKLKYLFAFILFVIISGCCPTIDEQKALDLGNKFYRDLLTENYDSIPQLFSPDIRKLIDINQLKLLYEVPSQFRGKLRNYKFESFQKDCNILIITYNVYYDSLIVNETLSIIKDNDKKYYIASYEPHITEEEIF